MIGTFSPSSRISRCKAGNICWKAKSPVAPKKTNASDCGIAISDLPHESFDTVQGFFRHHHHMFRREAKLAHHHRPRRGGTETIYADDRAVRADIALPSEWGGRLDAHSRSDVRRKDSVAVLPRLDVKQLPARHRDHSAADPFLD